MSRLIGVSALLLMSFASLGSAVNVTLSCASVGSEGEFCRAGAQRWAKQSGNTVTIHNISDNTDKKLKELQRISKEKSSAIDVFQLDVVWAGLFADDLVDLSSRLPANELSNYLLPARSAVTVNGKLVALPWFLDVGLLYYRKDLLKKYGFQNPPETWNSLVYMAKTIQQGEQKTNPKFSGYVWQGKNYEGLMCNALEWVAAYGGGTILDRSGKTTINNSKAAQALTFAKTLLPVSPKDILTFDEEKARAQFQSGNAAFMRNWSYAWALGQADDSRVKDLVGIVSLPDGGAGRASVLGGWNLGINKYSKQPDAALSLIRYLTGAEEQRIRALEGAYNPTQTKLYSDAEVKAQLPFLDQIFSRTTTTVARPASQGREKYPEISKLFTDNVTQVLRGTVTPSTAVQSMETGIKAVR